MGMLSSDLRSLGYERTEQQSPFDDDGTLWTKGFEAVCDETGFVIRDSDSSFQLNGDTEDDETVYRYKYSENVKLPGGYTGSYSWGETDDGFLYDK
jgi:hypothetical protein